MINVRYADGTTLTIDRAGDADAAAIARLYKHAHINERTYKERIDPNSPRNFFHIGGIFCAYDEASLIKEIHTSRSVFLSVKKENDMAAFLWVSAQDPSFGDIADGKTIYLRDIVVLDSARHMSIPHILSYVVFTAASRKGYTRSMLEIYEIAEPVRLLNSESAKSVLSSGGTEAGRLPQKLIRISGTDVDVRIDPLAFSFEYTSAIPLLTEKLTGKGVTISENAH
ncbi:MAG: hypothetical protein LBN97_02045 [Oscillospiraceae bacterium]|jgi:hypothetical protein|nr:hypothetical protein [Oscillospiraceae bacterium]